MIIGFAGRAGAGKSTAAEYLAARYGFRRDAYAATLKEAASIIFGVPVETFRGDLQVKSQIDSYWDMTYRRMLQLLGTEACRETFGADIWERVLWRRHDGATYDLVIDDVRFPNEAEAILKRGGRVIEIVRAGSVDDDHKSEVRLPYLLRSAEIGNNGTVEELQNNVSAVLNFKSW